MSIFAKINISIMENENKALPLEENKKECCENKKCRCCINLILNCVTLVAVIVLFILYFTNKAGHSSKLSNKSSVVIGFVNSDTIMENYNLVKELKTTIEAKEKLAEDSFAMQQKTFEAEVNDYQKKVQANALSISQAQASEKYLGQKQENLKTLQQELSQKLQEDELKMNGMLLDSITNFLKRYNRKQNFDYIFGFAKGSNILFANDSLDITKEVLKDINKEYKENHKEK
jgi:outer membrane protein